jgi:hypothetical protein
MQPKYTYRVKIINPARKKDAIVRELRRFSGKFNSVTDIKVRLMEELEESVPLSTRFAIGYKLSVGYVMMLIKLYFMKYVPSILIRDLTVV